MLIPDAAGHVSRAMLSRHSHRRMGAKGRTLDQIAARLRAADEKRKEEAGWREQWHMTFALEVVWPATGIPVALLGY